MNMYSDQRRTIEDMLPQSSFVFAEIAAVNERDREVKIIVEPWGQESGWCRVLKDTFYPIPNHANHAAHSIGGSSYAHDAHSTHEPVWPYKVGQEVLAGVVRGANGVEQYIVLGLIDKGPVNEQ
ncbi:hypothetical protein [Bacillus sp. 3255]|uniref:hypothetical protein n=1 Tax=Bacillus sp. 3255 TaxID=2817904 RepID=UPI0028624665|nr:hypothetical protein [Bacillus sp. 3255]MDR6883017.1 hypothetical protein [Bacillus sp. 3255]